MSRDSKPSLQPKKPKSGSRGSTLVGIFVGLILGALVAAGVALYFTSVSPFPRKAEEKPAVVPPPKPQSTGEPVSLPGKAGDKPVEKPRFDFYNVLPQGSDALPPPTKPEEVTEVVRPPKVEDRPQVPAKGDKAEKPDKPVDKPDKTKADAAERARAEAALLDKPLTPERYYLQAGSFEDPSEADNLKARLALMGVEAGVQKVELPEKGTVHRVRVGPYLGQDEMNKARTQLSAAGINAAIVKIKPKEPKPASAAP
ncbi:SPOR domain-containing protein [Zoogloea sp.]|uniref:SPOR domain-containing protein n=1 Tax=Zoogloea sp. TaxID=49181 RepID=UPI00263A2E61|nr:SPOR domain-containing protein [Zoogloea sp.]MDD3353042.1 SPOR domain-containing protein [Zoogloea sp.]